MELTTIAARSTGRSGVGRGSSECSGVMVAGGVEGGAEVGRAVLALAVVVAMAAVKGVSMP
jgi:hypothetical protein